MGGWQKSRRSRARADVDETLHSELVSAPIRFLKGRRGTTRSVPIGPDLRRALELYLAFRADLTGDAPLLLSPRL